MVFKIPLFMIKSIDLEDWHIYRVAYVNGSILSRVSSFCIFDKETYIYSFLLQIIIVLRGTQTIYKVQRLRRECSECLNLKNKNEYKLFTFSWANLFLLQFALFSCLLLNHIIFNWQWQLEVFMFIETSAKGLPEGRRDFLIIPFTRVLTNVYS